MINFRWVCSLKYVITWKISEVIKQGQLHNHSDIDVLYSLLFNIGTVSTYTDV